MKQKKKTTSNVKEDQRRYFNPYETSNSSNGNNLKSNASRHTYQEMKRTEPKRRQSQKLSMDAAVQQKGQTSKKKKQIRRTNTEPKSVKNQQLATRSHATQENRKKNVRTMSTQSKREPIKKKKKLTKAQRMYLKRKRQIQCIFRIFLVMIVIIGGIWGSTLIVENLTKTKISYQVVKMGSLDTSTVFEGVVFRNEKVILSEDEGYAKYAVAEGEKVEKDGTVYVLVDEENLATTTAAKEEVDSQIYNEAENKEALSTNKDKRYNLDQEVKNNIESFYNNRYDSSTSYIYTLRTKLDSSVTSRTELYASEQEKSNQALIQLKQDIEANLAKYHRGKAVAQPGLVSYYMDGHETENALEIVKALNYNTYSQYKKGNTLTTLAPSEIHKDDPIYKLVFNNEWYLVTYINTKDDQWTVGNNYDLTFDTKEGQSVQFTLVSKKEEESKTQLVFKSTNQIGKFLSTRDISFSIGDKEMTGLKIPLQSIVELNLIKVPAEYVVTENDVKGVYKQVGEESTFIPISTHDKKDDMYYIIQDLENLETVQLNDTLVLKGQDKPYKVTEIEVASGVYVINSQVAKFKKVEILTQNEEYALVKYNANSQLKEMDKIISNPKSVSKDQLLEDMKIQNE